MSWLGTEWLGSIILALQVGICVWLMARHHYRSRSNVLTGRDAREFERKVAEGLKHPVGLVPTPKADEIIKKIMKEAADGDGHE